MVEWVNVKAGLQIAFGNLPQGPTKSEQATKL